MATSQKYVKENGSLYIRIDDDKISREIDNLKIIIKFFTDKCTLIKTEMNAMDDESDEYYDLQDDLNDFEMVISDCEERYEDLLNIPKN